jgi:acyl-CoA hydrolase
METQLNIVIQIDITGQVCAYIIGRYQYPGVGDQMDFIGGTSISEEEKQFLQCFNYQ